MVNYVNTVLVSNLNSDSIVLSGKLTEQVLTGVGFPKYATSLNGTSEDAGKFIIMNCDPGVPAEEIYNVTAGNALDIQTIKVGIVTKKNLAVHMPDGTVKFQPIVKWSNEIKAADIKSYNTLEYTADTEDTVTIDFSNLAAATLTEFAKGGKRIIVRLTFKDMPHRYRKWTESYEYVTEAGDTKATIAQNIGKMINKEWKRARVSANTATTNKVILTAMPYDDDDNVDSLNWANKVRFNANIYWTDPAGEGWEANNKHFPQGVTIAKVPGKQYPASAKLVRDRESWAMGYLGILNRGEGTWPIIKPDMETNLDAHYDAITLEFENMYRAADDIQRKTKQTLEVYGITGKLFDLQAILTSFVSGTSSSADAGQNTAIAGKASQSDLDALASRVDALVNAQNNG